MLGWFKRRLEVPRDSTMRDVLFGDLAIEVWAGEGVGDPWTTFAGAAASLRADDRAAARDALFAILAHRGLESRHYLEAWAALRSLGTAPSVDEAKHLFGVVVEVALERGLDVLAAYDDQRARYLNFSGAAVVWDRPDQSMDALVGELLRAGREVVSRIGPWDGERPAPPPRGEARINLLTPSGLHFGQAPLNALANDALAGPVIAAATALMQALMQRARAGSAT